MKKLFLLLILIGAAVAGYYGFQQYQKTEVIKKINSFEECVAAGYPVQESYPPKCSTPEGKTFTQEIGNELELSTFIQVSNPRPNQKITSPLKITGKARGPWYFEATFPFEIVDENNKSLGKGFATAEGEWMTEEFVPFAGELTFEKPSTKKGKLIINNANPSGLPENEKELIIPVVF